jgi:four helix bundle protein
LDVYRVALEFQMVSATLLPRRGQAALRDQLDRASTSIVLCTAEGAGRTSRPDKARFYSMARGSATECAAVVDIAMARGLCSAAAGPVARSHLIRIVQMLTKLIGWRPDGGAGRRQVTALRAAPPPECAVGQTTQLRQAGPGDLFDRSRTMARLKHELWRERVHGIAALGRVVDSRARRVSRGRPVPPSRAR